MAHNLDRRNTSRERDKGIKAAFPPRAHRVPPPKKRNKIGRHTFGAQWSGTDSQRDKREGEHKKRNTHKKRYNLILSISAKISVPVRKRESKRTFFLFDSSFFNPLLDATGPPVLSFYFYFARASPSVRMFFKHVRLSTVPVL